MTLQNFTISRFATNIGKKLSVKADIPEKGNLLIYGAEVFLCGAIKVFLIVVLSCLLGIFWQTLVIVLAAAMFRFLTGGVHASAFYRCLVISLMVFLSLGYVHTLVSPLILVYDSTYSVLIMLPGLYWTLRYAPCPPENKPIKSIKVYKIRKTYASIIYSGTMALAILLSNWWAVAVAMGVLWQSFTLSPAGYYFIARFDSFLTLPIRKEGSDYEGIDSPAV